jgi:hypothetical protein
MKQGIFPFLLIACVLWLVGSSHASAQSVRIAVSGDQSLANLIDVTASELSTQSELTVLDRADLDKLGQEQEIQSVLDSKDFSPVRLLPADGLVLLRAVTRDGKTGVFARLVAVQPGVVLREFSMPDNTDPLTQAQALAKEFAPYWSKLSAIQKGKITTLSLLGLRFEVDAPETRDTERNINILLANRLSAERDTMVLERWRLNDALFEKTLSPQQPAPFWTGSSLIDGSMKWDKESNRIDVNLRLRPPRGTGISISDQDTPANFAALVGRLADKIQGHPSKSASWQPTEEAKHFTELGKWCLDNGLPEEGAEALESALALGDVSGTAHVLQAKAYAMEAYPADPHMLFPQGDSYRADGIVVHSLPQRVQAGRLAATLMHEYFESNYGITVTPSIAEDPDDLGVGLLYNCLRLLRAAYEEGFQANHADDVADLRHAIQKLILDLDQRILSQPTPKLVTDPKSIRKRAYLHHRVYYAGLWHDTPEEATSFYQENLGPKLDGLGIHDALFEYDIIHTPYLDSDGTIYNLGPGYQGPPWIVAWDGRSPDQIKAIWQNFLNNLTTDPDLVLQCDSLKFEFASTRTVEGRNAVLARYVAFLKQHSDGLAQPRGMAFASGLDPLLYWATQQSQDACRQIAKVYIAMYEKHVVLPPPWIRNMSRLQFYRGSGDVTPGLLAALNDYSHWYESQTPQDRKVLRALAEAHQTIYHAKPELMPAVEQAGPAEYLPVTRFWSSSTQTTGIFGQYPQYLFIDPNTLTTFENKIWFTNIRQPYQIYCVDPSTLQAVSPLSIPEQIDPPTSGARLNIHSLDVSSQWLAAAVEDRVFLYSRADNQWRALDLPPFVYKPRFVNQQLYLLFSPAPIPGTYNTRNDGSGLIRVSFPDGKTEDVVSSRRIPPQTALDGKPLGYPLNLWLSEGGLTLAVTAENPPFQAYATPLGKNDWSLLASLPARSQVRLTSGGALISPGMTRITFDRMILMGPGGSKLLLVNPDYAAKYGPHGESEWNFPKEWRYASKTPGDFELISPLMRGDDLCLYCDHQNGAADGKEACLYYFVHGQKDRVRIPLAFDPEIMNSSSRGRLETPSLNYGGLQSTDYGLVIYGTAAPGFWVIPWSDIDAYRARSIPAPASATPATASQSPDE